MSVLESYVLAIFLVHSVLAVGLFLGALVTSLRDRFKRE